MPEIALPPYVRLYETIYVLKPEMEDPAVLEVIEKMRALVAREGGKTIKISNWGKKKLAYEVKAANKGVYVHHVYVGAPKVAAEFDRNLRIMDQAILHQTVVLDKLWAAHPIDLPAAAVDEQVRTLQIDWLRRIGAKPEDVKQAPPREPFEQAARRRVAVGLLVGEVIRQQNITVDAAKFEERVEAAAVGYADPEAAMRQIRDNDQFRQNIEGTILEDQAVDWMLTQMKVTDVPATFKEIMNFGA